MQQIYRKKLFSLSLILFLIATKNLKFSSFFLFQANRNFIIKISKLITIITKIIIIEIKIYGYYIIEARAEIIFLFIIINL